MLPHVDISRACGETWSVVVCHALVSESIKENCFETSYRTVMPIFIHRGCPRDAVPAPILHDPRNQVSVAGNELHHHGPYRCVAAPTLCTRAKCQKVPAMHPPAGHHQARHSRCLASSVLRTARASGMPICSTLFCLSVHLTDEMHWIS